MIGRQVAVSSKLEHAKAKCKTMGESCSGVEEYELENGSRTYKLQIHSRLVLKSNVIGEFEKLYKTNINRENQYSVESK